MVRDISALLYQLKQPLSRHDPLTAGIDMAHSGRHPVDGDPEPHRLAVRSVAKDQMEVTWLEPVDDAAALLVENGIFLADRPISRQRPLVAAIGFVICAL
jgi:hypothetical protein